jgi:hypothetical protein
MKLFIENYKSIRSLELDCRRVNVLVGEPNCGKTNVIEAISLLGTIAPAQAKQLFRCDGPVELFHDNDISLPVEVKMADWQLKLSTQNPNKVQVGSSSGSSSLPLGWGGNNFGGGGNVKRYEFQSADVFPGQPATQLSAPFGDNLASLLAANKELRLITSEMYSGSGLKSDCARNGLL